jgi:hypothetical protein
MMGGDGVGAMAQASLSRRLEEKHKLPSRAVYDAVDIAQVMLWCIILGMEARSFHGNKILSLIISRFDNI